MEEPGDDRHIPPNGPLPGNGGRPRLDPTRPPLTQKERDAKRRNSRT